MPLDINFVRARFSQLHDNPDFVFCANAGGSYVADPVRHILNDYNAHTRVQPYERYAVSARAGEAMERAKSLWAEALNIAPDELTIGPSTSMNTYVLAQAIGAGLTAHDEIIVTNQDHEANSGVWRAQAAATGATVREWRVQPDTGLLDPDDLESLLRENTRWVFFNHCSNIVGTTNPVAEITATIRRHSPARVFVDAVAHAPHHICDLKALDVDGYVFSLYKVYGPHQSLMYVRAEVATELAPQCHYFNTDFPTKRFNPAGPQHAQVAACAGVLDYFEALYRAHFDETGQESRNAQLQRLHALILPHESALAEPLLNFLHHHRQVRLLGKPHIGDGDRAPTIAFRPLKQTALAVATAMQARNIGCESGHFYAARLLTDLGIPLDDGVVRISLVHYANADEVAKILCAMEEVLGA